MIEEDFINLDDALPELMRIVEIQSTALEDTLNRLVSLGSFDRLRAIYQVMLSTASGGERIISESSDDDDGLDEFISAVRMICVFIEMQILFRRRMADAIAASPASIMDPGSRINMLVGSPDEWKQAIEDLLGEDL